MKRAGLGLCLLLLAAAGAVPQEATPDRSPGERSEAASSETAPTVAVVQIVGPIMSENLALVRRAVQEIKVMKPDLVIFEIDTPGGRIDYMLTMGEDMMGLDPIPTASYIRSLGETGITGGAWSAGAFLAMSCKKLYMAPGTVIGAATPVAQGPGGSEALPEKYVSGFREKFRARAEQNGYPAELAVAMVDINHEVYEVEVDGTKRYLTWKEIEKFRRDGKDLDVPGTPYDSKETLLTMTDRQVAEAGMGRVVSDRAAIYAEFGITAPIEVIIQSTWSEDLVGFLTSGFVSVLLLVLGVLGIWVELKSPGFGAAGVVGVLSFALLIFGHHLAGLAAFTEVVLIVAGIALIAVEIFLLPGFGISAIAGVGCLLAGMVLMFQEFNWPEIEESPWQLDVLLSSVGRVLIGFLGATAAFFAIVRYLPKVPVANRLVLQATVAGTAPSDPTDTGDLVGRQGHAMTPLRPAGKIHIDGEMHDVLAEGEFVATGEPVEVLRVEERRLIVGKLKR